MQVPMKRFSEMDQGRVGLAGVIAVVLLLVLALSIGLVRSLVTGGVDAKAAFTEAGGLRSGADVRVAGLKVGTVRDVTLDGKRVLVAFTVNDVRLGDRTRAAIKTENPLGAKFLALTPEGAGELADGDEIPLSRTHSPYSVTQALGELTTTTGEINTDQLARSFDTVAETFGDTPPEFRSALDGVRRISETVSSHDDALNQVLAHANGVSGILSERNAQITRILSDGNALLAALQARKQTIDQLLVNVTEASHQLSGLVEDNRRTLKPALEELQRVTAVLNKNQQNIEAAIRQLGPFAKSLGESVGGGPWFYSYVQNIPPTNLAPILPGLFGGAQPPSPSLVPGSPLPGLNGSEVPR